MSNVAFIHLKDTHWSLHVLVLLLPSEGPVEVLQSVPHQSELP